MPEAAIPPVNPEGIINTAINAADPSSSVAGYTARESVVDPATQTVQGQIESIINKNSPLQQMAATRAKQEANRKGVLNSTMAIQAGQAATYAAALPIATSDAAAYHTTASQNRDAVNTARSTTATNQTEGALQVLKGDQSIADIEATGAQEQGIIQSQGVIDSNLAREEAGYDIAEVEATGVQDRRLETLTQEGRVALADKDSAMRTELQGMVGDQALDVISANFANEQVLLTQKADIDNQLLTAEGDIKRELEITKGLIEQDLEKLLYKQEDMLQAARIMADESLVQTQGTVDAGLMNIEGGFDVILQDMKGKNGLLLQTSQAAASLWSTGLNTINTILLDTTMDAATKKRMIGEELKFVEAGLAVFQEIMNDGDIAELMDFSVVDHLEPGGLTGVESLLEDNTLQIELDRIDDDTTMTNTEKVAAIVAARAAEDERLANPPNDPATERVPNTDANGTVQPPVVGVNGETYNYDDDPALYRWRQSGQQGPVPADFNHEQQSVGEYLRDGGTAAAAATTAAPAATTAAPAATTAAPAATTAAPAVAEIEELIGNVATASHRDQLVASAPPAGTPGGYRPTATPPAANAADRARYEEGNSWANEAYNRFSDILSGAMADSEALDIWSSYQNDMKRELPNGQTGLDRLKPKLQAALKKLAAIQDRRRGV